MAQIADFRSLPLIVRIATLLVFLMAWVLFAELIIDRHGLASYLPFYRVGNFCPYDVAVILILVGTWWNLHRRKGTSPVPTDRDNP